MSDRLPDPPRWKDHRAQANVTERAAGCAFRSLASPRPLSTAQVGRIARELRAAPGTRRRLPLWLTVTAALLLGGATAASAAHLRLLPRWLLGSPQPSGDRTVDRPGRAGKARAAGPTSARLPPSASPPPLPAEPSPQAPRGREAAVAVGKAPSLPPRAPLPPEPTANRPLAPSPALPLPAPAPAVPVAAPTTVSLDGTIARRETVRVPHASAAVPADVHDVPGRLGEAIRLLRIEHAPSAALAVLDRHEPELRHAALAHEVLLVRVEALLALHRERDALHVLDDSVLDDVAGQRSLLLTRGELRVTVGRCADAVADFDRVLAASDGRDQRAARGRAACGAR